MVVYTVRKTQHEGVALRSSIQHEVQPSAVLQLQEPNPSAVLLVQYRNNHEITYFTWATAREGSSDKKQAVQGAHTCTARMYPDEYITKLTQNCMCQRTTQAMSALHLHRSTKATFGDID